MLRAAEARHGIVTAPHHLASQAGLSVLKDGGNAVEAMVAAAATIAVVYPHMNGIGGDGFWLIAEPGSTPVGIDACGRAAMGADVGFYARRGQASIPARGPLAANTVAGAVSGWGRALATCPGRLPLARLLEDAIRHAREGVPVTNNQVDYTVRFADELAHQPGFGDAFMPGGRAPTAGTRMRFPALAATFERLASRGLGEFYEGETARSMASELARLGSPLRFDDFAHHRSSSVAPLSVALHAGTAYNLPPPTQGVASLMILAIVDRLRAGVQPESFEHVHLVVEATKQAFVVRNQHVRDPDAMLVDAAAYLADDRIAALAAGIDRRRAQPWPASAPRGDTVWMGAADGEGRIVSYIQSVYWEFGSGVVLRDTGVTWQNRGSSFSLDDRAPLALAPGRKPFHTLNPALARLADGRTLAYGAMGGDGQPQSQAAIFTRHVMFGRDLQESVSAPRWLLGRTWGTMSVSLKLEDRFDATIVDALRRAGHEVELLPAWSDVVGHAGAIAIHPDGTLTGAFDPRSDGAVAAF